MFDLETAVQDWRQRMERQSSLSPREVDELEDHLRARIDLELELDGALTPARAFATARENVGEPAALSTEFAKGGKPVWRRLLIAGWAMFGVSMFLPVFEEFVVRYGYEVFFWDRWPICLPMLLTLWGATARKERLMSWLNGAAAAYLVVLGLHELVLGGSITLIAGDTIRNGRFLQGYWTWTASQVLVTAAVWIRARRRKSARVEQVPT